jgi:ELWxxDGT repeat protein
MKFSSAINVAISGLFLILLLMHPVDARGMNSPFPWALVVDTASEPIGVVNRTLEVNFAKSASVKTSRNMSVERGRISRKDAGKEAFLTSSTIEAPIAFSSLGVKWVASTAGSSLGIAIRTSTDSTHWSPWIDISIDEHLTDRFSKSFFSNLVSVPVDARYIQYSVNVARTEGATTQVELTSLAFAFIEPGTTSSELLEQLSATTEPVMLSRTGWGCPDGEESPSLNEVQTVVTHLIVHHTATSNTSADWPATVRAIWSYHTIDREWGDIGYNFLVDPQGTIYVGRAGGDNIRGAHFVCRNGGTQGIAMLGNFTSQVPTTAAVKSLEELLAWLTSREEIDPVAISFHEGTQLDLFNIAGHRDGNPSAFACSTTVCPGDTFYPMIADIRSNVEILIAESGAQTVRPQVSSMVMAFGGNAVETSGCYGMIEVNGEILANVYNVDFGCVLYRLDAQGNHQLMSEIDTTPGVRTADKYPGFGLSPPFGGWYYFEGDDGFDGKRLWRTDGGNVEAVNGDDQWISNGILLRRGIMNGRLYISARNPDGDYAVFSTDGEDFRREPELLVDHQSSADLIGSFYDNLFYAGTDTQHGDEPWVFDGSEYRLLEDIVLGSEGSKPRSFFQLGNDWFFAARKSGTVGEDPSVFFRTDGKTVKEIPHSGTWRGPPFDEGDLQIKVGGTFYIVKDLAPLVVDPSIVPTPVMRVQMENSIEYDLGNTDGDINSPSGAVLGNNALVFMGNRLYRLGETEAEEISLSLPTEWEQSSFEFVGSGPYFKHVYIKEKSLGGESRVWAWNEEEAGLVMAGDTNVVTSADHFRHIGNDIYFYGEDDFNGRALRKLPGILIKPLPWMGAVTGSWYDPSTSGQGFVLHAIDDNRTVISFYGFEHDGTPLWLTGLGKDTLEAGRSNEITMYISSGGKFGAFEPGQIDNLPWGTLNITFNTCRKATAVLDGQSGKQTMDMNLLAGMDGLECYAKTPPLPKTAGVTGSWYDPATSGQGIVLHSISDNGIVISFYGYKNNSERLWLIGLYDGEVAIGKPLVLDMIVTSGGNFGTFIPGDITRTNWGTLTIQFDDCNNAIANLDGIDGQQTMNMVKLARLQGSELGCEVH